MVEPGEPQIAASPAPAPAPSLHGALPNEALATIFFFRVTPHGHAHENSQKHLRLQGALSFPRMQGRGQGLGLAHARRSAAASTLIMMPNYRGRPSY